MHKSAFILACCLLIACTSAFEERPRLEPVPVEVVAMYPHDPGAFTQGLVIAGGRLFESTGKYGESALREVELETGRVLRELPLTDDEFGEGVTVHDGRIIQLTWHNRKGFVYDLDTLTRTGTFPYRGEGWGLTTDGERLIMSDGSDTLRFLDPWSFEQTGRVRVTLDGRPLRDINALQYRDGRVLANIWRTTLVAEIDPRDGRVIAMHDLAPLVERLGYEPHLDVETPNGIALAADGRLFMTGKYWPALFEVRLR